MDNLDSTPEEGEEPAKVKASMCECNKNADRVFKGPPDCNTCVSGYLAKPNTTICVENTCEPGSGLPSELKPDCQGRGVC